MVRSHASLFETPHGRVIRCTCRGRLEVASLGERLQLSQGDFHTVAQTVERAWLDIQATSTPSSRWRLIAHTDAGRVSVGFRADDTEPLRELLHGTSATPEPGALPQNVLHS